MEFFNLTFLRPLLNKELFSNLWITNLSKILFCGFFHFVQNHRRDLFRIECFLLASVCYTDFWFSTIAYHLEGPVFLIWHNRWVIVTSTNQSLSICKMLKKINHIVRLPIFRGARCSSVVRAFAHGAMGHRIDPIELFSFQPVLHDLYNKGCGMCYPVCGMMHIKEPLLLIRKSSPCGSSRFPLSLSEWSFTICTTPYNGK